MMNVFGGLSSQACHVKGKKENVKKRTLKTLNTSSREVVGYIFICMTEELN